MSAMTEEQQHNVTDEPPCAKGIAHTGPCEPPVERADPPEPTKVAQVQVVTAAGGWPAMVVVDGVDMTRNISRVVLEADAGQIPRAYLTALGAFSYDGAAVVEVGIPAPVDPNDWIRRAAKWMDHEVDWQAVQRAVAEGSMGQSVGDAIRVALADALAAAAQAARSGQEPG
jgi:hypothetical protein